MILHPSSRPSSAVRQLGLLLCAAGCALTVGSNVGCSDDDADAAGDGSVAAGRDGGHAGTTGGSRAGTGGAGRGAVGDSGAGSGAGSGADEDSGAITPSTDGAVMDPDADGGTAGDPASGGSGGTGGTGAEPAAGCAGLMQCCAQLADPAQSSCNLVTTNADDATCEQFQSRFCNPPAADKKACQMLNDCCKTLPRGPLRLACATTVMDDMALECQSTLSVYCPANGDPTACTTLSACCDSLVPPQRAACNAIVDQDNAANCGVIEAALCP